MSFQAAPNPEPSETIQLPIALIRTDFQSAECLGVETVQAYAEALRAGDEVAPIIVQFDGQGYWLRVGFHGLRTQSVGMET